MDLAIEDLSIWGDHLPAGHVILGGQLVEAGDPADAIKVLDMECIQKS